MSVFRESSVIVIETSKRTVRAGLGLGEFIRAPTIEVPARVGLRKNASTSKLLESGLADTNGKSNGHSFENGMDVDVNGQEPKAAMNYIRPQRKHRPIPDAKVSDYLVGKELDDALAAGENIEMYWPLEEDDIRSWPQVEALWKYVLFNRLGIKRKQNESPVALSIPSGYSRNTHERLTQVFFERFNVAGFMLLERPLGLLFAANAIFGVVIDISYSDTTITPIADSIIQHSHEIHVDLGIRDCELYLANILRSHQQLVNDISAGQNLTEEQLHEELIQLVQQIWRDNMVKVPTDGETAAPDEEEGVTNIAALLIAGKEKSVIENATKKKSTSKQTAAEREREREIAALDLVQVEFKGKTLTLGRERHRFCEPLFDPELLTSVPSIKKDRLYDNVLPLQEGVHMAVNALSPDKRFQVWGGVFIAGEITMGVKGLGPALHSRLSPYLLLDQYNNRFGTLIKVPEYFGEFRDKGDGLAAFLGTSIVAKLAFNEPASKNYVSKTEYGSMGPVAILEYSPTIY
ncbi:hypothetical protein M422DRAFT_199616 [Sphaerobolus stellatus SS14]|nr:hypothetical protein M422DRAFT_199616 [Sphaerobolus stellatus SS14]